MSRLCIVLVLAFLAMPSVAGERFASVEVTGSILLPPGKSYPAKVRIDVEIAKIEPGKVITFHKIIGRQEINFVKSTPLQFAVRCPKSYLKDTPANLFTLRAKVYDMTGSGRKLLYETARAEALQPISEKGLPKQNLTLPVKSPVAK